MIYLLSNLVQLYLISVTTCFSDNLEDHLSGRLKDFMVQLATVFFSTQKL
jgi:hypothetical protein